MLTFLTSSGLRELTAATRSATEEGQRGVEVEVEVRVGVEDEIEGMEDGVATRRGSLDWMR